MALVALLLATILVGATIGVLASTVNPFATGVVAACPNATLVLTWFLLERHTCEFGFPQDRCRWVNEGESWRAGDCTMTAILPPLYGVALRDGVAPSDLKGVASAETMARVTREGTFKSWTEKFLT